MEAVLSLGSPLGNVLILGVAFFLTRISWISSMSLLDTLDDHHLTRTVLNVAVFTGAVCSVLLPPPALTRFGHKKCLLVGLFMLALFGTGNMITPKADLFVPLAILSGVGMALASVSALSYVTHLAKIDTRRKTLEERISIFMGVFFTFHFLADMAAVTLAFFVTDRSLDAPPSKANFSCGVDYCLRNSEEWRPITAPPSSLDVLPFLFVACPVVAIFLVTVCLDNVRELPVEVPPVQRMARELFLKARDFRLLLLVPLAFYVGVQKYFLIGEFSQAYVACNWGARQVSAVLVSSLGVSCVLTLLLGSWIRNYIDRPILFCLSASLQVATLAVLWNTNKDSGHVYYSVAVAFGVSDAIWQAPLKGMWGLLFRGHSESGLSLLTGAELLGAALSSGWTSATCLRFKLTMLTVLLPLGMLSYGFAEYLMRTSVGDEDSYRPLSTEEYKPGMYLEKVCKGGPTVTLDVSTLNKDSSFLHRDSSGMHREGSCRVHNIY